MAWAGEEVAGLLREYAELSQITGGDVFRARNYSKAARSVRGWGQGEDFLAGFDVCVAPVHSHFEQPRAETTRRWSALGRSITGEIGRAERSIWVSGGRRRADGGAGT
jgi:Helix-hairpin-helix domain